MLIALVLAAWMPWCLCAWAPNVCGAAHLATDSSVDASAETSCCHQGCCSRSSDESTPAPTTDPCESCPSACCAPKHHLAYEIPTIPCDTIGLDLPIDQWPAAFRCPASAALAASDARCAWPPGAPPGRATAAPPGLPPDGRAVLLRSSVLRT
jgi:hypothetical protein